MNETSKTIDHATGGQWWVTTRDSHHILDLENWLYKRFPGPQANSMVDAGFERVDMIQPFSVGDRLQMTMAGGHYRWRVSSAVKAIEPYTGQDADL